MGILKRRSTRILWSGVLLLTLVSAATQVHAAPPQVVCVPWHSENGGCGGGAPGTGAVVPHDTWEGKEITLKGTAHDPDGDSELATYKWDFGDGSPPVSGAVTNPYAIEAKHTYAGDVGDKFVAKLTVTDTNGESGSDDYLVEIKDGTKRTSKVNVAIDEGLWYLHKQQRRGTYPDGTEYGYWDDGSHPASNTGAATEAFEIHGSLPMGDPSEDPYVETVRRGLNYLLAKTHAHNVPVEPHGDPDTNGNGIGLGCYTDSGRTMYECGITLMTFASSLDPNRIAETGDETWVKGRAYREIVQDMVDYLAWGQNEGGCSRGGWRYSGNHGDSDNSCSQWPVIGMEAAERNFGTVVPGFVKDELPLWLGETQNSDGGFSYGCDGCSNVARTGAGCAMMAFCGIPVTDSRFQSALSYLDNHWTDDHGCMGVWEYHFSHGGNYYAFYGVMKGMRLPEPDDVENIGARDWYADYADFIVADQESNGGWLTAIGYHEPYLGTAWAILTLRKTWEEPPPVACIDPKEVPRHPPLVEVCFDASCSYHRNPCKDIVLYQWDFDANDIDWENPDYESNEPNVCHGFPAVYDANGDINWPATEKRYMVTLRVVDDGDPPKYDIAHCDVNITGPPYPPVAKICGPHQIQTGRCQPIYLDGCCSYDPEEELYPEPNHPWHGRLVSWEWDLDNDGEYDDATGCMVEWSSCVKGLHVVGLKVTDNYGLSDTTDKVISVTDCVEMNMLKLDTGTGSEPIYLQPHDLLTIDMDALCLAQEVYGCQAVLNFSSIYFYACQSGLVCPVVAAGGGVWDELIYSMWTTLGDMDVAIGVDLDLQDVGTQEDGTVAKITLTSNGMEGVTKMVFREDGDITSSTFFADANANRVDPNKVDSQDIYIDGTDPYVAVTAATQNSVELLIEKGSTTNAVQGVVNVAVAAHDALARLAGPPDVTVMPNGHVPQPTTFVGENPSDTFNYTFVIDGNTPNGIATITARATDKSGNLATDIKRFIINKNQATGMIELRCLDPQAGGLTRTVVFAASGGIRRKTWSIDVNFAAGSSTGPYTLTDLPDGTTCLSAKTDWNLRRKLTGLSLDAKGQLVADFTDANKLLGGDLNDNNAVEILDYAILKRWYLTNGEVADITGDGIVNLIDYSCMVDNWFKQGDSE